MSQTIARQLYDAFNRRDFTALANTIAPDATWAVVPTGFSGPGRESVVAWAHSTIEQFPDARIEVTAAYEHGTSCTVEFVLLATHPSGVRLSMATCEILVCRDQQIVSGRVYVDTGAVPRQLAAAK
jgi:ketosteroid isomerase-like protein